MEKYTTLIVDDDEENLNILELYLKKYCKNLDVIGRAQNASDAIELYYALQPQLLFLDVELEDKTGFDILESIGEVNCEVILVTSHKKYAINAFDFDIVDYIVKPIDISKLVTATAKAIKKINQTATITTSALAPIKFIAIPSIDKIDIIDVNEIVYCESEGRYTRFFLKNENSKMSSRNLGEYEKLLKNNPFFRIHHQYLVNLNAVISINKAAGNYCEMVNQISLPIAKRRLDGLARYLKIK